MRRHKTERMVLKEDCLVSDNSRSSEIFHGYFISTTKTLNLKASINSTTTSLSQIIKAFKDHAIIKKIIFDRRSVISGFVLLVKMMLVNHVKDLKHVLSHASKTYETVIFDQMSLFFKCKFYSVFTGFCNNHSSQNDFLNTKKNGNILLVKIKSCHHI